jgi:hypothetical protein
MRPMVVLLSTLAIFALAMTAMAIGVMMTGRRLQGSCGGSGNGDYGCPCDAAKRQSCARKRNTLDAAALVPTGDRGNVQRHRLAQHSRR